MRLQDKNDALLIWEKNKYIDWNNFHYINSDKELIVQPIQEFNDTDCKTCLIIDDLCETYYRYNKENSDARNDELINKILSLEINVYSLMKLRESFGFINLQLDGEIKDDQYVEGIYDITHYLYSSDYSKEDLDKMKILDPDINDIRTDCARWCSVCGARKPNVYK